MESKLKKLLKELKISNGDHLILHGNLAIFNQNNKSIKIDLGLKLFLELLKKKIGKKGIILIPTFTYSFCSIKRFDIYKSKSELGMFSELSRKLLKSRTSHPIFSFAVIGDKREYLKSSLNTCFGKGSVFDYFRKNDGKILCLGCGFGTITFLHHIEEIFQVDYRENKVFSGYVKKNKNFKKVNINYYVRKNQKIKNNFINFEKYLKKNSLIQYHNFDRFNVIKVNSREIFGEGIKILKRKPHYFI